MLELSKAANVEIAKFVHTQDLAFRVRCRRNKNLALWVAAQLELNERASDYAKTLVAFALSEPDDEALIQRIQEDLSCEGLPIPEAAIRFELERQATLAMKEYTLF
jgi:hypothetical protein